MTSSGNPNPKGNEVSVDGISIKDKTGKKADDAKRKSRASDAAGDANAPGTAEEAKHEPLAPGEGPGDLERLKSRLSEQEKLAAEYLDLLKRKQADFENFRKRSQKENDEFKRYATTELVIDILGLLDNFERAVESAKTSRDFDALLEGVLLIKQQFKTLLEKKYSVKKIEAVGKEFDPTMHDAVMVEESDTYDKDMVIEDLQRGYVMHDRVLRPSKVKVAKGTAKPGRGGGESGAETSDERG